MTVRFYILPIERNGRYRGPRYFNWSYDPDPPGIDCQWSIKDYGSIDMGVVAADIADTDHNALILNSDVYAFPVDLDSTVDNAGRTAINNYYEVHGIPADWVGIGDTYRSVLRITCGVFLYLQRVLGIIGYPTDPYAGLTLNTQYRNIPNPLHDAMQTGAISLGYTWDVVGTDQIRKIFKMMSDQWGSKPIYFGFVSL